MKPATKRRDLPAAVVFALLAALLATAVPAGAQGTGRYDEFGLIPNEPADDELALPDPVLDRTWPLPKPGEGGPPPEKIAPDEEDELLLDDLDRPAPPPEPAPRDGIEAPVVPRPSPPLIGSDGPLDPGSPAPAPDPEQEENLPSPLDRNDEQFKQESGDPTEW